MAAARLMRTPRMRVETAFRVAGEPAAQMRRSVPVCFIFADRRGERVLRVSHLVSSSLFLLSFFILFWRAFDLTTKSARAHTRSVSRKVKMKMKHKSRNRNYRRKKEENKT